MVSMDIHGSDEKITKALNHLKDSPNITSRNKKLIEEFHDQLFADNLSPSRILKYIYILKKASQIYNKDFDSINKKDVVLFFKYINTNKDMAEWTKNDYKVLTRKFYQWLNNEYKIKNPETKCAIKQICNTEIKSAKSREKLPEHLITPDEVRQIADNTLNSRDKSFVLVLYESACRIGELIPVKIKDAQFDQYGCVLNITGKTGARTVRLCASAPSISNWLQNHPERNNPEGYLYCGIGRTNYKKMLSYGSVRKIVFDAAKKAGIKKRVNLHKFRASRATHLVKEGMPEPTLCKFGGWEIGSSEIKTYVKLSNKDVEDEILRINGLMKKEDAKDGFKLIICPRCNVKNYPGARFCSGCSLLLDDRTISKFEKDKENATKLGFDFELVLEDSDFRVKMMNMMAEEWDKLKKKKTDL